MSPIQQRTKTLLRLGPIFLLAALVSLHPASVAQGAGQGREFFTCIIECAAMFRECRNACRETCADLGGTFRERLMCLDVCVDDCRAIRADCRDECRGIKPPPTPDSP